MYYAYFVRCADGTLYGGYTTHLEKRLQAHNSGKGAKYTRSRRPVELVYWEECATREAAMAREWQLKHLTRAQKLALIQHWESTPAGVSGTQAAGRETVYHYYLFHKPFGCVTARTDDRYPTVMDWFRELDNPNLSPVGRLDRETEGLLVITDDGQWNSRMTRPEHHREKTYEFVLMGDLTEERIARLDQGVLLRGQDTPTAPARITVTGKTTLRDILPTLHPEVQEKTRHNPMDRPATLGTITITEGRNRQIRRMMKAVNCLVLGLKRISMGGITLPEDLPPGAWREIFPEMEE